MFLRDLLKNLSMRHKETFLKLSYQYVLGFIQVTSTADIQQYIPKGEKNIAKLHPRCLIKSFFRAHITAVAWLLPLVRNDHRELVFNSIYNSQNICRSCIKFLWKDEDINVQFQFFCYIFIYLQNKCDRNIFQQ